MRLFIAIPVPPDIRRAAADTAKKLEAYGATGRFTDPKNYHVTLHFIGESDALSDAAEAMHAAVQAVHPFLLRMGEYGTFAGKGGGTGYVRMTGEGEELSALHEMLVAELWEHGFSSGNTRFIPHITLGRSIKGDEGFAASHREAFLVNQLVLFESTVEKGQPVYIPIHREVLES